MITFKGKIIEIFVLIWLLLWPMPITRWPSVIIFIFKYRSGICLFSSRLFRFRTFRFIAHKTLYAWRLGFSCWLYKMNRDFYVFATNCVCLWFRFISQFTLFTVLRFFIHLFNITSQKHFFYYSRLFF